MKISIRESLISAAAALAVAVPAVLAGPALAEGGNAGSARYEAYVAAEAKANAASHTKGRATKQVTRVGAADSSVAYSQNGTKRFHLDVAPGQEQHYLGN